MKTFTVIRTVTTKQVFEVVEAESKAEAIYKIGDVKPDKTTIIKQTFKAEETE